MNITYSPTGATVILPSGVQQFRLAMNSVGLMLSEVASSEVCGRQLLYLNLDLKYQISSHYMGGEIPSLHGKYKNNYN